MCTTFRTLRPTFHFLGREMNARALNIVAYSRIAVTYVASLLAADFVGSEHEDWGGSLTRSLASRR